MQRRTRIPSSTRRHQFLSAPASTDFHSLLLTVTVDEQPFPFMLRNATPRCTPRCTPRHTLRGAVSTLDSLQRSFNTESAATPKRPSPSLLHRSAVFKPKERGVLTGRREGSTPPLHYVAPQEDEKRLLRPAVLSERIQRLCRQGNIDDAVLMLKNAPLDAQNTIVWNTMMSEALKVKRFKLAYQTYIDVRKSYTLPYVSCSL